MGGLGSRCRSRVSVKERRKKARGTLVLSGGGRGWDGHEPALRKKAERGRRTVAGERVEGRGWRTALSSGEAAGAAAPKGSLQSGAAAWGQLGWCRAARDCCTSEDCGLGSLPARQHPIQSACPGCAGLAWSELAPPGGAWPWGVLSRRFLGPAAAGGRARPHPRSRPDWKAVRALGRSLRARA